MKQNTKHAVRATQIDRQAERKTYPDDKDSLKQANREGRGVGETKAIIGKAPRLGTHKGTLFLGGGLCRHKLALQLHQERAQVVCTNRKARNYPAQGQSRNGPST